MSWRRLGWSSADSMHPMCAPAAHVGIDGSDFAEHGIARRHEPAHGTGQPGDAVTRAEHPARRRPGSGHAAGETNTTASPRIWFSNGPRSRALSRRHGPQSAVELDEVDVIRVERLAVPVVARVGEDRDAPRNRAALRRPRAGIARCLESAAEAHGRVYGFDALDPDRVLPGRRLSRRSR